MLIYAHKRWQESNWHSPLAVCPQNGQRHTKSCPRYQTRSTSAPTFTGTRVSTNPKHWYHFGCPVYVLVDSLQAGNKIDKWSERRRTGVYLGQSSQQTRTAALVLSHDTGLTFPRFHINDFSSDTKSIRWTFTSLASQMPHPSSGTTTWVKQGSRGRKTRHDDTRIHSCSTRVKQSKSQNTQL
jgi:hypothetical protein